MTSGGGLAQATGGMSLPWISSPIWMSHGMETGTAGSSLKARPHRPATQRLLGYDVMAARAEPSPEIAKIGFVHNSLLCESPQYLTDELLRREGSMEVEYVEKEITIGATLRKAADIAIY